MVSTVLDVQKDFKSYYLTIFHCTDQNLEPFIPN